MNELDDYLTDSQAGILHAMVTTGRVAVQGADRKVRYQTDDTTWLTARPEDIYYLESSSLIKARCAIHIDWTGETFLVLAFEPTEKGRNRIEAGK